MNVLGWASYRPILMQVLQIVPCEEDEPLQIVIHNKTRTSKVCWVKGLVGD